MFTTVGFNRSAKPATSIPPGTATGAISGATYVPTGGGGAATCESALPSPFWESGWAGEGLLHAAAPETASTASNG